MSSEREGEGKGFKVVDRRRFTTEGDERDSPDIPPAPVETKPAAASPSERQLEQARADKLAPAEKGAAAKGGKPDAKDPKNGDDARKAAPADEDTGGLSFTMFLQSLTQQALMQLGLIPWPHTRQRELHLDQARDTIDVLSLLRAKTKGNLSQEEESFFESVMYELRMSYVEVTNAIAAGGLKGGPGGPMRGAPPR